MKLLVISNKTTATLSREFLKFLMTYSLYNLVVVVLKFNIEIKMFVKRGRRRGHF